MLRTTRTIIHSILLAGIMLAASGSPAIAEQVQDSPTSARAAEKLSDAVSVAADVDHAQESHFTRRASTKSSGKICPECTHVKI